MPNSHWRNQLRFDPLPELINGNDPALAYFARRDLLHEPVPALDTLAELPEPVRLVQKQMADGSWRYPGKTGGEIFNQNYSLLETYRSLRVLVEMYGLNQRCPSIQRAAAYIFTCQTEEGDIRGILGNQYMPYYHGAILELLIKAGYSDHPNVLIGLDWLLSVRQMDGGWIVPAQAVPSKDRTNAYWTSPALPPDTSLPHAHLATGMVLRAFAAHPKYRALPAVQAAGQCLKERLFKADRYNDRRAPAYWLKFQYPFWWTSLITAMDTLQKLGFARQDSTIALALDWLITHQEEDGLWPTGYGSGSRAHSNRRWVALAVCRILSGWE